MKKLKKRKLFRGTIIIVISVILGTLLEHWIGISGVGLAAGFAAVVYEFFIVKD